MLENLYFLLDTPNQIPPGQVALIVSVFAAAAYFLPPFDDKTRASSPVQEAHYTTSFCAETARALINRCVYFDYVSLEVLQAIIILSGVVGGLEGPSYKYRCLLNQALTMAQELKLHVNDHIHTGCIVDQVQKEVQRRVWWYLATTDWFVCCAIFPQRFSLPVLL